MPELLDADDVSALFTTFGSSGTYTPNAGSPVSVTVVLEPGGDEYRGDAGEIFLTDDRITFNRAEVDAPLKDATVVIGSDTYLVGRVVEKDDTEITVVAQKR